MIADELRRQADVFVELDDIAADIWREEQSQIGTPAVEDIADEACNDRV